MEGGALLPRPKVTLLSGGLIMTILPDHFSITAFCQLLFDIIINSLIIIWLGRSPSGAGSSSLPFFALPFLPVQFLLSSSILARRPPLLGWNEWKPDGTIPAPPAHRSFSDYVSVPNWRCPSLLCTEDAHSNSSQNMALARIVVAVFRSILISIRFQWTSHWMDAGRSRRAGGRGKGSEHASLLSMIAYSTSVWSISQITMEENSLSIIVPIESAL